jgi:hypothetical protein
VALRLHFPENESTRRVEMETPAMARTVSEKWRSQAPPVGDLPRRHRRSSLMAAATRSHLPDRTDFADSPSFLGANETKMPTPDINTAQDSLPSLFSSPSSSSSSNPPYSFVSGRARRRSNSRRTEPAATVRFSCCNWFLLGYCSVSVSSPMMDPDAEERRPICICTALFRDHEI